MHKLCVIRGQSCWVPLCPLFGAGLLCLPGQTGESKADREEPENEEEQSTEN